MRQSLWQQFFRSGLDIPELPLDIQRKKETIGLTGLRNRTGSARPADETIRRERQPMNTISYNRFIYEATRKARENDTPISGYFELTPLCNLDCRMCYVHLSDPSVKGRMLSGDQWIGLMEQAIAQGMMFACLTGGECLTHPDFKQIYMYLIDQGVSVRIKTNGILLNRDMLALFTAYPPYVVDVSLYGCDGESYRAVTGYDVFETVTANIRAAIAAGLHLRLMVTPSAYMLPWVDRVMEYAKSFGADDVFVNVMLMEANPDTGRSLEDYGLSLEENARIHRRYLELFPRTPKTRTEEAEPISGVAADMPGILPRGLYCNGGRTAFAIWWDGVMSPCLDFPRDVISADVRTLGFEAAWRAVNRGVKDYTVPEACRTCSHNTSCYYCPSRHRTAAAQHQCSTAFCTWRKLLADIEDEYGTKSLPLMSRWFPPSAAAPGKQTSALTEREGPDAETGRKVYETPEVTRAEFDAGDRVVASGCT